ncbi:hypothetical protein EG329_012920 [Mollisiaceae sp. DMI_Dod_QoI]|nr:hypothetical protein EG329_012920 [Helotiales sp. DMI_Dod_QoI]
MGWPPRSETSPLDNDFYPEWGPEVFLDNTSDANTVVPDHDEPGCVNCPFHHLEQGQAQPNPNTRKAFRLQETFENGTIYNAYSFGDRKYHEFSPDCLDYHIADSNPKQNFVFTVYKTKENIDIMIHSFELFLAVYLTLEDLEACSNGLLLLKNLSLLEKYLDSIRNDPSMTSTALPTELVLLVKGLLSDTEPFVSFGLTSLYERGYIDKDRVWCFQLAKLEADIKSLEGIFHDQGADYLNTASNASVSRSQSNHVPSASSPVPRKIPLQEDRCWTTCGQILGDSLPFASSQEPIRAAATGCQALPNVTIRRPCNRGVIARNRYKLPRPSAEREIREALAHYHLWNAARKASMVEQRIRHLHKEFAIEHERINEFYRTHSQEILSPSWYTNNCNSDHGGRTAWSKGFAVMRKLIRREQHYTVHEIIMFLAVVKSICAVEDAIDPVNNVHNSRFQEDLSRWQMLFVSDPERLHEFRMIVHTLWDVTLDDWQSVPPCALTSMAFDQFVRSLVADTAPLFRTESELNADSSGFLSSQEIWHSRTGQYAYISGDMMQKPDLERSKSRWEGNKTFEACELPLRDESSLRSTRAGRLANSASDSMVPLLIAGAIFGILIAFLISLNYLRSKVYHGSTDHSAQNFTVSQSRLQAPVIEAALDHIIKVLKTNNLLTTGTIDLLKSDAEYAIASCNMSPFSELVNWLHQYVSRLALDDATLIGFRSWIQAFGNNWASSYAVQSNYRLLEVYFGFKTFLSIVPKTLHTECPDSSKFCREKEVEPQAFTESSATVNLNSFLASSKSPYTLSGERHFGPSPSSSDTQRSRFMSGKSMELRLQGGDKAERIAMLLYGVHVVL